MKDSMISVNPATGEEVAVYEAYGAQRIARSLRQARKAFEAWRRMTLKERGRVLRQIAAQLRKDQEKLAALATLEMGKPIAQSRQEVLKCAATLEYYAKEGPAFLADTEVETDARHSFVSYQPLGVVLAVMPWNFPYWQVFRAMAPALMAGNTMVLKHASNVTGCALAIAKLIRAAGAPDGLFQTLVVPSSRVEELIASPEIAAVTFTGSTAAGRKVAEAAGRNLKKQVLELGGSDAYIILDDADLDLAVQICVDGRLVNSGQSCVSAKRFIPVKEVSKAFEAGIVAGMKAAAWGDPSDTGNRVGPLARMDLREELHRQVTESIARGAKLLCGGYIPEGPGAFYPPTVLTRVKPGMPAYDEELFGPVAAVIQAKDERDALRIANDSVYGLGGGIFSRNRKKATALAATEFESGNCFVNSFVHSDARLPFGGVKQSGYGRELGIFGIREFVNIKTIFVQ